MKKFLTFIKSPKYIKSEKINWKYFFSFLLFALLFSLFYAPVYLVLSLISEVSEVKMIMPTYYLFIGMIFIVPVIEEIIFRLILKPSTINLILIVFTGFLFVIVSLIKKNYFVFALALITALFVFSFLTGKGKTRTLQRFILKNFRWLFYISCILFGLIHIFNYSPFTP